MNDHEERLAALHARLVADRERIAQELERYDSVRSAEESAYTEHRGYGTHLADDASGTEQEETDLALERNLHATLAAIIEAIHRFERGEYGICEDCGKSIDIERLEAIPWAALCIEDRARRERAAGHARRD